MKKKIIILSTSILLIFSACTTHTHIIGKGAQGSKTVSKRQLWVISLVPINEVDTGEMAGDATDYEIETKTDVIDLIVSGLTSGLIVSRKVTVKK
ncbi:MAG: hypothetical protein CMG74_03860 [Candidatus Marinimicrobia bacterium]|nr:hypothetical protein [Candidatus Neomarinimicrobiota bacterium]|tara:strand:+ start:10867 stop:11151 length:285 start_codon:yes stop_codon:yes gene_type:complete